MINDNHVYFIVFLGFQISLWILIKWVQQVLMFGLKKPLENTLKYPFQLHYGKCGLQCFRSLTKTKSQDISASVGWILTILSLICLPVPQLYGSAIPSHWNIPLSFFIYNCIFSIVLRLQLKALSIDLKTKSLKHFTVYSLLWWKRFACMWFKTPIPNPLWFRDPFKPSNAYLRPPITFLVFELWPFQHNFVWQKAFFFSLFNLLKILQPLSFI